MFNSLYSLFTYGKSLLYVPTNDDSDQQGSNSKKNNESAHPIDRMNTTRNFSDRFEFYYNLDDDLLFYNRNGWSDYCNNKLGLVFKYPTLDISCIEVLPLVGEGIISVQLRENQATAATTTPKEQDEMLLSGMVTTMFNIEDVQQPHSTTNNNNNNTKTQSTTTTQRSNILNQLQQEQQQANIEFTTIFGPKEHLFNSLKKFDEHNFPYKVIQHRSVKINSRKAYECKLELEMKKSILSKHFKQFSTPATTTTTNAQTKSDSIKVLVYLVAVKQSDETNKFVVLQHMTPNLDLENFENEIENKISHIVRSIKLVQSKQVGGFTLERRDLGISMKLLDEAWQCWKVSELEHDYINVATHVKKKKQVENSKEASSVKQSSPPLIELPQHLKDENVLLYLVAHHSADQIVKEFALIKCKTMMVGEDKLNITNTTETMSFDQIVENRKSILKQHDNFIAISERVKFDDESLSEGILFAHVDDFESFPIHSSNLLPSETLSSVTMEKYNVIECYFTRGGDSYKLFSRCHYSQSLSSFRESIISQFKCITFKSRLNTEETSSQQEVVVDNTFMTFKSEEHKFEIQLPLLYQVSGKQSLGNTPVCQFYSRYSMHNVLHMFETQIYFELVGAVEKNELILTNPTHRLETLKQSLHSQMVRNLGKPIPLRSESTLLLSNGDIEARSVVFSTPIGSPIHQKNLIHFHTQFIWVCPSPQAILVGGLQQEQPLSHQKSSNCCSDDTVYIVTIKSNVMESFFTESIEKLMQRIHSSFKLVQ